jgi:hypothetical protein
MGVLWLQLLDLHGSGLVAEGSDEGISVAILCDRDGDFGLDDGVDSPDLVCDLPGALEEDGIVNVALFGGAHCDRGERDTGSTCSCVNPKVHIRSPTWPHLRSHQ